MNSGFKCISRKISSALLLIICSLINPKTGIYAQSLPSPKEHFGFSIGDNYKLATYTETEKYFKKLESSERVKLVNIGQTEEGRNQYMLIISSPSNIKTLERFRDISGKLARVEGIDEKLAAELAEEGKAVVWIDGGLHATEVVGSHQLIETAWQLASRNDKETLEILDNVIVLLVHANPDGQELVSTWYMKESDSLKRRMNIPRLYQKYAGHDNNRDFYMLSMKETRNMSTQLYLEWFPQVLYNHHQSGPAGTVLAGPPYRDPFNYVFDPLVMTTIDALGAAMINRLNAEGKPGFTSKSGASYSTWYNGGLRTASYFHNIAGLLTEIIGNPTPSEIPFVPDRLLPSGSLPYPVTPQKWYFRQSIDYSVSLNYAVLNYASRHRNELLLNIYRMGKNSVDKGRRDTWTTTPADIKAVKDAWTREREATSPGSQRPAEGGGFGNIQRIPLSYYEKILKDPAARDPRAYIIPSDQTDFPTAVWFVNSLLGAGIKVYKAEAPFSLNKKSYPAGSFIIRTDQAFRPYIIDLFEAQDHPDDLQYPGGPPIPPYDAAGWTLVFQMGIEFDRILEEPGLKLVEIPYGQLQSQSIEMKTPEKATGYIFSAGINNSFKLANELLKKGFEVYRLGSAGKNAGGAAAGSFYVPLNRESGAGISRLASENGIRLSAARQKPGQLESLKKARIAIWNRYGGSMPSGWLSWIMEKFSFDYTFIYSQSIDSGDLRKKYDIIIMPSGSVPAFRGSTDNLGEPRAFQPVNESVPDEYKGMTGSITSDKSIPQLKRFIEDGGSIVAIGSSTSLGYYFGLPVKNALIKKDENGTESPLRNTEFYIPGSLLTADVDSTLEEAWGMPRKRDFYFDQSPVFRLEPDAASKGVRKIAWFSSDAPLHSGWALGQSYLKDGVAAYVAAIGSGKFCAFGPEITFRSQPHGTFKLLFNQLYSLDRK